MDCLYPLDRERITDRVRFSFFCVIHICDYSDTFTEKAFLFHLGRVFHHR